MLSVGFLDFFTPPAGDVLFFACPINFSLTQRIRHRNSARWITDSQQSGPRGAARTGVHTVV